MPTASPNILPTPLNFATPAQLQVPGLSIDPTTSPEVVTFSGSTYLFFRGSGGDGIWFSTLAGVQWQQVRQIVPPGSLYLGSMGGTNPSAVVVDATTPPRLFLFYTGVGGNGVFYSTTLDANTWTPATQIVPPNEQWLGIMGSTSPCAIVFDDLITLFYTGNGSDGIFSVTASDPSVSGWNATSAVTVQGGAQTMPVLPATSPSAVVYQDEIYLFFSASGNTISFTKSADGVSWSGPQSLRLAGAMDVSPGTSPTAFVLDSTLYVFWQSSSGVVGTVMVDNGNWLPVSSPAGPLGPQAPGASAALLGAGPSLFWTGPSNTAYSAAFTPLFSLVQTPLSLMAGFAEAGVAFQVVVDDASSSQMLGGMLPSLDSPQAVAAVTVGDQLIGLTESLSSTFPASSSLTAQPMAQMPAKLCAVAFLGCAAQTLITVFECEGALYVNA